MSVCLSLCALASPGLEISGAMSQSSLRSLHLGQGLAWQALGKGLLNGQNLSGCPKLAVSCPQPFLSGSHGTWTQTFLFHFCSPRPTLSAPIPLQPSRLKTENISLTHLTS